jgi:hypothetical protein
MGRREPQVMEMAHFLQETVVMVIESTPKPESDLHWEAIIEGGPVHISKENLINTSLMNGTYVPKVRDSVK